jgi:hypothetical protein
MRGLEIEESPIEDHILSRSEVMIAESRMAIEAVNLLMRRTSEQTNVNRVQI